MRDRSHGQELPWEGQESPGDPPGTRTQERITPTAHVHRLVEHDGPLQDVGSDPAPGCGAGQVRAGQCGMGVELCSPAGTGWRSRAVPMKRS